MPDVTHDTSQADEVARLCTAYGHPLGGLRVVPDEAAKVASAYNGHPRPARSTQDEVAYYGDVLSEIQQVENEP